MADYVYLVTEITSGDVIGELPLSGVSFESFVSAAGKLSATLTFPAIPDPGFASGLYGSGTYSEGTYGGTAVPSQQEALSRVYRSALDPVRCAVHVLRDGVPIWGGPLWLSGYTMKGRTARLQAAEWYSFLKKRLVIDEQVFTTDDLHDIVRSLVDYTQGRGDLGIDLDATLSGETLSITYAATEVTQVGKAIETLGAQLDGFEFAIDLAIDSNGDITRKLNLSHPTRGRNLDDSGLMFEYGRNIVDWTEQHDGASMAGSVTGVGKGQGEDTLLSTKEPTTPLVGYPLVEATISFKDVADQGQLDALTQAEADRRRLPVRTVTASVLADNPDLGSYRTGDEARFVIPAGTDPWHIDGMDETIRILGIKVNVDDDGGLDIVDLTLDNLPDTEATVRSDTDRRLQNLEATS